MEARMPARGFYRLRFLTYLAFTTVLFSGDFCMAQPDITLSRRTGSPTTQLLVSGTGFQPTARVRIFFDSADVAIVTTDANGSLINQPISVPRSSIPGEHWISVVERNDSQGASQLFVVNTNWPQFHFSPNREGSNPYENVLNLTNVDKLGLKWSFATNGYLRSSPAVVDGILYVGSDDYSLYALDASTGAKLWQFTTGNEVESSPAVAYGTVYVGSDDGKLYALNAKTGSELWQFTAANSVASSPVVVDGVVYFGSFDNNVYALDARTGTKLWQFTTGEEILSSPAIANGVLYIGSDGLYAINAKTGKELWQFDVGDDFVGSPVTVADGMVYFGAGFDVYAVNAATGAYVWGVSNLLTVYSGPAVADGIVYFANYEWVYAVEAKTGHQLWQFASDGAEEIEGSPVVANGVVYVASDNLYAISAYTGRELWQSDVTSNGYAWSSPAVANGVAYVAAGSTYTVYAFSLADIEMKASAKPARLFPPATAK
jgi:eukaryotic-like serine/threonine-protein kinase